ncbi:MAG TPA: RNA polymerase subunit sigma-70 [Streptosporangiaceae bacterium]|nr:RNA polymerase subunit sigma-70 [Streptosporangiaceae bacterium]
MGGTMLGRATGGDEAVFAELFAAHRRELHRHCYRMLGSVTDADDLVQETMIAAWRGWADFAGRSSARAWLYRIATHRCLNAIRDGKRRPGPAPAPPFTPPEPSRWNEVTWLQPYPDAWLGEPGPAERYEARESIELAFIAALQRIPARQTAAVVLCDVLGYSGGEVALMLGTTPASVKGLLQRARAALARDGGAGVPAGPAPAAGSAAEQELAQRFARAFSADDVPAVVALLTDDAWLAMPPAPHEYLGPAAIAGFLQASAAARAGGSGRRFVLRPARYNGQVAFGCALGRSDAGIVVLTLRGDRISGITRFLDPAGGLEAKVTFPR